MSGTPAPKPRRALRRTLIAAGVLLALLVAFVGTSPWWFDARRVASLAMDQADAATGIDWSFEGEPALRWDPAPWLALPDLRAVDAQGRAVIAVERAELSVPWSTLRGEDFRVDALRLETPDLDLDAALEWWNARPAGGDGALPILNGLSIADGTLRWSGGRIESIDATLPRFAIGEPFDLRIGAKVRAAAETSTDVDASRGAQSFDIRLALKATARDAPLRLESIDLELSGSGPVPATRAGGNLTFAPWALEVSGTIASWPEAWPALPAPLSAIASPIAFSLSQAGDGALDAPLRVDLRRDEVRVDAALVPRDLLSWLEADTADAATLPPITGSAAMPAVEIDGITLEGVSVEIVEEATPNRTPAGTTAAPASPAETDNDE